MSDLTKIQQQIIDNINDDISRSRNRLAGINDFISKSIDVKRCKQLEKDVVFLREYITEHENILSAYKERLKIH